MAGEVHGLTTEAGRIAIRDTDGSVSLVDQGDLAAALTEGARPATRAELVAEHAGLPGQIAAGAVGIGRGATFGFSDPAAIEASRLAGGDASAESTRVALDDMRRAFPGTSLAGEVGGALVPALLTGGTSAGATLGRVGARMAAEGAAMGVGHQASEDWLGDKDLAAENYVGAGLVGGALGGILGLGTHAAASAVTSRLSRMSDIALGRATGREASEASSLAKYAAKDVDAVVSRSVENPSAGLGQRFREGYAELAAGAAGKDATVIKRMVDPAAKDLRRVAVFDGEAEIQAVERALRTDLDGMVKANQLTMSEFQGELKTANIARVVKAGNEAEVRSVAQEHLMRVFVQAEQQLAVAPRWAKRNLQNISKIAGESEAALAGGRNADAFIALDRTKREIQSWVSGAERSVLNVKSPMEREAVREQISLFTRTQDDLRNVLENGDLWGKAGDIQRAINEEWSTQIGASKRFNAALMGGLEDDPTRAFKLTRNLHPTKLSTYVRNLTDPKKDITHAAVRDYVESTERLARLMKEHVSLPPDKARAVEEILASASKTRKGLSKAEETLTAVNQYKELAGGEKGSLVAAGMGMLGVSVGGPVGGAVGLVTDAVFNPGKMIARLAAVERMGGKLDARAGGAFSSMFGRGAPRLAEAGEVSAKTVEQVREVVANPDLLRERMRAALAELNDTAPGVAAAAMGVMMRAAYYLQSSLPQQMAQNTVLPVSGRVIPPTDSEMASTRRRLAVVADPGIVPELAARGRLLADHVAALREVYPQRYQRMRQILLDHAVELRPTLTTQQEVQLSLLFDQPVTAMMRPEAIAQYQAMHGGTSPQQQKTSPQQWSPKRPLGKSRTSMASRADRLERDEF